MIQVTDMLVQHRFIAASQKTVTKNERMKLDLCGLNFIVWCICGFQVRFQCNLTPGYLVVPYQSIGLFQFPLETPSQWGSYHHNYSADTEQRLCEYHSLMPDLVESLGRHAASERCRRASC